MRNIAFAAVLAATAATPALAQDAASAPFTGPRIEVLGGWDRVQANGGHDDGLGYGVAAGYDIQHNNMLLGVDAEAADSTAKECVGSQTVADPELCVKAGRDLYVGGRVGAVVNGGKALLYAKAGYTNARERVTADNGTISAHDGTNLDGLRVGAGVEYALGTHAYAKAEYRYSNYEQGFSRNQVVGGVGFRF